MIRMGRSSKNEDTSRDTTALADNTTAFPLAEAHTGPAGALSESESMARDIKEGRLSGFVGAGTILTGETNFQSMLRVDGHLTGRVTSEEGTLIIGSTGQVDANIDVACAIVNGQVNGDIVSSDKLELGRTARVVGNIKAPRLIMSEGALLEGSCNMIQSKETLDNRIEEQKQQFSTSELSPVTEEEADEESTEEGYESLLTASTESSENLDEEAEAIDDESAEAASN